MKVMLKMRVSFLVFLLNSKPTTKGHPLVVPVVLVMLVLRLALESSKKALRLQVLIEIYIYNYLYDSCRFEQ